MATAQGFWPEPGSWSVISVYGLDLMSGNGQELALPSPAGSPESKRMRTQTGNPDAELDELIPANDYSRSLKENGAPEWALTLHEAFQGQLDRCVGLVSGFHDRLQGLERQFQSDRATRAEESARIEQRLTQLEQLAKGGQAMPAPPRVFSDTSKRGEFSAVPPPESCQVGNITSQATTSLGQSTDYNHVVIGGWPDGSKRDTIIQQTQKILATHTPALEVTDLIVYGKRASSCHLFLNPVEHARALQRYEAIRQQLHDRHPAEGHPNGQRVWFTASKPRDVRMLHRRTMGARTLVETFLRKIGSSLEIEPEWSKALIWVDSKRIAAAECSTLMLPSNGHKTIAVSTDSSQPQALYHFNVTALSNLTGAAEQDIEQAIFNQQP